MGVLFLFFLIGVEELDIPGFAGTLRGRFALAGAIAFLVPFGASFPVGHYVLDLPIAASIARAGVLSLSSLGVAARVLGDLGHLKEPLGLEIFTTVLIVELVGILVVGFMLHELKEPGEFEVWKIGVLLAQIAGFVAVAWVLVSYLSSPLVIKLRTWIGVPQLSLGILAGSLFLAVVGAERVGLHGSLGALLFGTALSALPHRLRSEVIPSMRGIGHGLFIPLFFASAGLHIDLSFRELSGLAILAILATVAAAVLGKLPGSVLGPLVARLTTPFALASGIMAKGVVEIALLLVLLDVEAITPEIFSLAMIIMLAYILVMPPVISAAVNNARVRGEPTVPDSMPPSFARYALDGVKVEDILDTSHHFSDDRTSVKDFVEKWVVPHQHDYVIVKDGGQLAGIFSLPRVRFIHRRQWQNLPVGQLLRRHCPLAYPDDDLDDVLENMAEHWLTVIPVVDRDMGEFLGAISSGDVMGLMVETDGLGGGH